MHNQIRQLNISGFKGFSARTIIPFSKLTVLAGANSVGKSTIVQSLLLIRSTLANGIGAVKKPSDKISLNGNYLLALGNTQQITKTPNIAFSVDMERGTTLIQFNAPIDMNYLMLNRIEHTPGNCLDFPNFHYLNAERIGPRPLHEDTVLRLPSTGYKGEFAVQLLVEGLTFDTMHEKNFHKVTKTAGSSNNDLSDQVNNWMQFLIPGINVVADRLKEINRSIASFNNHTPPNVGFGISYVLPIVVSGLIAEKGSIFIVENPEAHLHPSGQSRIGQFLAMVAASGVQVIVETHSEHVVNGIRVASLSGFIPHSDIVVNFLSKSEPTGKITVTPIEVNAMGDLTDFPFGFFDQVEQDLVKLTQIRRSKK